MKRLFTAVFFAAMALYASATMAQDEIMPISVGKMEILALEDGKGTMKADLLPQIADDPVLKSYFDAGPLPSVYRCYYFQDGDHRVLVDTGWGEEQSTQGALLKLLRESGISPDSVTDILMTHLDMDHVGGLVQNGKPVFPKATLWIAKPEFEAWSQGQVPGRGEKSIKLTQRMLEIYKDKIRLFNYGEELLPGVKAIDARGHTPGHTAYEIVSENDRLLIAGDLLHIAPVQLINPDMSSIYDGDPKMAAEARKRLLKQAVDQKAILGTMHLPAVSPVRERSDGGYAMREAR